VFKVNEYFDGKVKSISFTEAEGAATVGVLAQGDYEFNTGKAEIMSIVSGKVSVSLPGENGWREVKAGEVFNVPANSKFGIEGAGGKRLSVPVPLNDFSAPFFRYALAEGLCQETQVSLSREGIPPARRAWR